MLLDMYAIVERLLRGVKAVPLHLRHAVVKLCDDNVAEDIPTQVL